jgi:hypothetical protein
MSNKIKNSRVYKDAVASATRVLTEVNGRPPKPSTVAKVVTGLLATIPASQLSDKVSGIKLS